MPHHRIDIARLAHESGCRRLRAPYRNPDQSARAKHGRRCSEHCRSSCEKTDLARGIIGVARRWLACNRGARSATRYDRANEKHDGDNLAGLWKFGIWLGQVRSSGAGCIAAAATFWTYVPALAVALAISRRHPSGEYSEFARG